MPNLPYHRALLWLFVEQRDERYVEQQFDELSLPLPDKDELQEYQTLATSLTLSPLTLKRIGQNKYDANDHGFLKKLGYEEIYLKTVGQASPAWNDVRSLVRNPVARTAVDVGILCKYTLDDLAQMIPPVFQEKTTEEGLALYRKYFFDDVQMTKADWRSYLKLCSTLPFLYVRYHAALTKNKKEAMFLAGLPSKSAFTEFLKNVLATAEYKFEYYSRHNNQTSDAQARHWAKVGFDAGVRHERYSSNDVTDFSKAVQTEFRELREDIPTITTDMLSEVKPPDVENNAASKAPAEPVLQPDLEP